MSISFYQSTYVYYNNYQCIICTTINPNTKSTTLLYLVFPQDNAGIFTDCLLDQWEILSSLLAN